MSTLPILALVSIPNAIVHSVKASSANTTDIEIRQDKNRQTATIRIPANALIGKKVSVGMRAEAVADSNGHTLVVEGKPIVYIPGPEASGLVRSKKVQ